MCVALWNRQALQMICHIASAPCYAACLEGHIYWWDRLSALLAKLSKH